MLTEPKAALAGVMLETSFARFRVSIAAFNEERELSRRFGCAALGSMSSESTWHKEAARASPNPRPRLRWAAIFAAHNHHHSSLGLSSPRQVVALFSWGTPQNRRVKAASLTKSDVEEDW